MVSWAVMMRRSGRWLFFALLLLPAALRAQTISYAFQVRVEARALGSFGDLGTAIMKFTPEKNAGFRVQGGGDVVHPMDAAAVYRYTLDMRFQMKRDQIQVLSKKNTSNKAGEEILHIVEEILPFVYLAQVLPRAAKGYTLGGGGFGAHTLTYAGSAAEMEIALTRGTRPLATFFMKPAKSGPAQILRFRINRKSGTNLMFVPR